MNFRIKYHFSLLGFFAFENKLNAFEGELREAFNTAQTKDKNLLHLLQKNVQSIITKIEGTERYIAHFDKLVEQYERIATVIPSSWKEDFIRAIDLFPKIRNRRAVLLNEAKNYLQILYSGKYNE